MVTNFYLNVIHLIQITAHLVIFPYSPFWETKFGPKCLLLGNNWYVLTHVCVFWRDIVPNY